jgi:hypothetical protein
MRISLLDHHGKELDFATVDDVLQAPAEAMMLLARLGCLYSGSLLSFDDDKPHHEAGTLLTVSAGNISSLAGRLEQRAGVISVSQPLSAGDLQTAARLCRHFIKVGWITGTISIA